MARATYINNKNIKRCTNLVNLNTTTTRIASLMGLKYNEAWYLRNYVMNKMQSSALNDKKIINLVAKSVDVKPKVGITKKARTAVTKKRIADVISAKNTTPEVVKVDRKGNNITITINLAI